MARFLHTHLVRAIYWLIVNRLTWRLAARLAIGGQISLHPFGESHLLIDWPHCLALVSLRSCWRCLPDRHLRTDYWLIDWTLHPVQRHFHWSLRSLAIDGVWLVRHVTSPAPCTLLWLLYSAAAGCEAMNVHTSSADTYLLALLPISFLYIPCFSCWWWPFSCSWLPHHFLHTVNPFDNIWSTAFNMLFWYPL